MQALFFKTRDFDFLTQGLNGFSGLMLEHVCVKFGDPSCSSF